MWWQRYMFSVSGLSSCFVMKVSEWNWNLFPIFLHYLFPFMQTLFWKTRLLFMIWLAKGLDGLTMTVSSHIKSIFQSLTWFLQCLLFIIYLIGLKGETWIKSESVFSDTDTLEIQFLVQDSQNLRLCMMYFLKYLISHFFIFSRTDLHSHYLDREDKEQPEKRLHNLRYVVIW